MGVATIPGTDAIAKTGDLRMGTLLSAGTEKLPRPPGLKDQKIAAMLRQRPAWCWFLAVSY
jgi:hypothetical protein